MTKRKKRKLLPEITRREFAAFIRSLNEREIPVYSENWAIIFPNSPEDLSFIGQVEQVGRKLKLNSRSNDGALVEAFFHELAHMLNWTLTEEHIEGMMREFPNVFLWLLNEFLNFVETINVD